MKTETEKITKKGGVGVGGVKGKSKSKGKSDDCEITIKYRTLILWFIAISIIVVSCSQIYFFTPQTPDKFNEYDGRRRGNENRRYGSRHQDTITKKTTKGTGGSISSISSISKIIAKRQDYGRNGIINNKKTTAIKGIVVVDNNDDVDYADYVDATTTTTTKVAKNSDGSINHKQIYKNHISNYNNYLHQHQQQNSNVNGNAPILLPDIEKELEETEIVAIERNSSHNDDDNNDNDDDEPWLVLHIGPPKTATTHIQCGLEKYSLRLAKEDKYHFLGGGCGVPEQEYVMPNSEETVLRRLLLIALHHRPPQKQQQNPPPPQGNSKEYEKGLQHLQKTLSRMAYLRKRKRHVILSGEQFGSQLSKRKSTMSFVRSMLLDSPTTTGGGSTSSYGTNNNNNNNNNSTTTTYLASKIKITAGYKPNKIRIVLAYRHFVDWLPSYYYQNELILDNAMDEEWIVHGPSATGKNQKHRTQGHSGGRVQSFLKYADEYLTNWELHSNDVLQWIDTIQQKDVTTTTNSTTISSSEKPNRRKEMLLMLPDDRHSIHPSWWLYSLWSSYFPLKDQVQVYDMHSPMNMNLNVNNPNQDKNQDTMLTDFICHMLPTANKTCHKLWSLETNADTVTKIASPNDADDIVNYEEPYLHSSYSFLYPGRDDKKMSIKVGGSSGGGGGGGGTATSSDADTGGDSTTTETDLSSNKHSKQSLIVRKSSDHHSTRIVEELLVRGDIEYFTYENEDELRKYFEDENAYYEQQQQYYYDNEEENDRSNTDSTANKDDLAKKPFLKGLVKSELIELAETILTDNGVLVLPSSLSSSSISAVEQPAFSEKYFDCMSSQLEERLLNASSTFMDLMYKHTPMLSLATAATFPSTDDKNLIQKEKVKRWKQAKIEHARLFQKNKRKGKYCDINPDKVFQNNPKVYNILKAFKFKPSYLRFKWNELPLQMRINAQLLGYDSRIWDLGKKAPLLKSTPTLWKDLQWNYKLSAFQLGYDIHRWNRIVTRIL